MTETENPRPQRKRIRLDRAIYDGPGLIAMVTITTRERKPAFLNAEFTHECISTLRHTSAESSMSVPAYCFMPDHVHLLVHLTGNMNLIDVIRLFKGRTPRVATEHGIRRGFWQKSFYDHLLREDEDESQYIQYILENPVRARLVRGVDEYPFVGTFEYDVESLADLFP